MKVLHVNKNDAAGGAARIALDIVTKLSTLGYIGELLVEKKLSKSDLVFKINNDDWRNPWTSYWQKIRRNLNSKNIRYLPKIAGSLGAIAEPGRILSKLKGLEDFDFPGTEKILTIPYDILHLHNLHSSFFDLRMLPELSKRKPTVLTLHDAWLFTGHCAYYLDCMRWKYGCGNCPDLSLYPQIMKDETKFNWERKKEIYKKSSINIVTPSKWLMDQVENSVLSPAINKKTIINNGVELNVFFPGNKSEARRNLKLPVDSKILLFVGNSNIKNRYKNYSMIQKAVSIVAENNPLLSIIAINLGEDIQCEYKEITIQGTKTITRFYNHIESKLLLAKFYNAADVFLHAARAENFPLVILEAMACGLPVIATDVGGIPEQIIERKTGFIVPPNDGIAMGIAIEQLLNNDELRKKMGKEAAEHAGKYFGLDLMIKNYVDFYKEILIESK